MKKSLLILGTVLLLNTSVYAQNWNAGYAAGGYGTYQQPVTPRPAVARPQQTSPVRRAEAPKNNSPYRIGNPLYHPAANQGLLTGEASYYYTPKEEKTGQDRWTGWTLDPSVEVGMTNKFSIWANVGYGQFKGKSGTSKGIKDTNYNAEIGLRYLLASADGFDFNVNAGLYYDKWRRNKYGVLSRNTGTDIALQVGKKIQNITPYFAVGFVTDFWSKRGSSKEITYSKGKGTDTYINPGVYIDLTKFLSLNLNYTSEIHEEAWYRGTFDFYATRNTVFSLGGFIVHPETDKDTYGATVSAKVAF